MDSSLCNVQMCKEQNFPAMVELVRSARGTFCFSPSRKHRSLAACTDLSHCKLRQCFRVEVTLPHFSHTQCVKWPILNKRAAAGGDAG